MRWFAFVLDPMLAAHELARLCERLGLSAEARVVIESIRSSPPARRVRSAAGNVSVRYPSRKMGVTIQAESHHVELAAVYEYEHDPQTLEFYDQPPSIKLVYEAKNGRQVGIWHTPDYFVIRSEAAGWEEWKTEVGLERLAETMPHRYLRDETGHWRCPPGERLAERFGLYTGCARPPRSIGCSSATCVSWRTTWRSRPRRLTCKVPTPS
jgi:hypothetical protein